MRLGKETEDDTPNLMLGKLISKRRALVRMKCGELELSECEHVLDIPTQTQALTKEVAAVLVKFVL